MTFLVASENKFRKSHVLGVELKVRMLKTNETTFVKTADQNPQRERSLSLLTGLGKMSA